jgi:hypothetical protein
MVTVSLASLLSFATAVVGTLNANWPRWVGNLANIAQIGGGLAAVVAFLSGRLSAIKRSRGSAHRGGIVARPSPRPKQTRRVG